MLEPITREQGRCNCPPGFEHHAMNCPVQPNALNGEHWKARAEAQQAEIAELRERERIIEEKWLPAHDALADKLDRVTARCNENAARGTADAERADKAEAEIARLTQAHEMRSHATVYERAAWHHDIGEHKDSEHPYAFCPRCEMEHPRGRFAEAQAEIARLTEKWEQADAAAQTRGELFREQLEQTHLDNDERSWLTFLLGVSHEAKLRWEESCKSWASGQTQVVRDDRAEIEKLRAVVDAEAARCLLRRLSLTSVRSGDKN